MRKVVNAQQFAISATEGEIPALAAGHGGKSLPRITAATTEFLADVPPFV
jgi:hypothetical protein